MKLGDHTHCPTCQADLRVPDAVVNVTKNGQFGQCRQCRNKRQRERNGRRTLTTTCLHCGNPKRLGGWAYCSRRCQNQATAGRSRDLEVADAETILELCEARERCSTHWEREELTWRIKQLTG